MSTIQLIRFQDGCFVLHKIAMNGSQYSCWYSRDGKPFSAERFSRDSSKTFNVPERQHEVWRQLEEIGSRYVEERTKG